MKTENSRVDSPRRPLRVRTDLRAGLVPPPAPIRPPQWMGDIEIGKGV